MNPHQVTRDFESALCEYTGAPFAVTTNSCTMALTLAVAWHRAHRDWSFGGYTDAIGPSGTGWYSNGRLVEIPKRTYISVPMSIIHAGGRPVFRDEEWSGSYRLRPLPVWDCARIFTSGMWDRPDGMACVSFHASKTLGHSQGGAILHNSPEADAWLRRARFDGRSEGVAPKDDTFPMIGWHCYLSPDVAAALLLKLHSLPRHNAPLPNSDYPDLSRMEIFR